MQSGMIIRPTADPAIDEQLGRIEADGITRFTLLGGSLRGAVIGATALCTRARINHGIGVFESLALSQALMGAALYAVSLKEGDRVSMRVDCTGALRGWSVEADWAGNVRGHLFVPALSFDRPPESFDLQPLIGSGTLSVRRFNDSGQSFGGVVELAKGRIAEDLVSYWLSSEQTKTALSLSVSFDKEGRLSGCTGILLQALPGAADIDLDDAQDRLAEMGSISKWTAEGKARDDLIRDWYGNFDPVFLERTPVSFSCPCSHERFRAYLKALGRDELTELVEKGPFPVEVVCHSCSSRYDFDRVELAEILKEHSASTQ
jgi:molecular chaperone Hsp33